ncbi:MAG: hypothetical protein RKP20_14175 [Candidatus Competibacter sp.]|nr:hypothetical protein [Candidatus Competibacter sp.]
MTTSHRWIAALLGLVSLAAQAAPNTADVRPASTLLLPYFEIGAIPNFPAPAGTPHLNSVVTVGNATASPVLARVTLWTDYGIPTLSFHLNLTAFDRETLDLRMLFDGVLPPSNSGVAGINGCADTGIRLTPADIIGLRDAHRGQPSALFGNQCGGSNQGDGLLRGYLTIDAVTRCDDTLLPNDAGYSAILGSANALWGSWSATDSANNYAMASPLVHVESGTFGASDRTFYGAFNGASGADQREALGSVWAIRYLSGDTFNGTGLRVWREPRSVPAPVSCGGASPAFLPGDHLQIVAFDEQENPVESTASAPFPLVTQQVAVNGPQLPLPFNFGWLFLNLNSETGAVRQSHVAAAYNAAGRFSVGLDGVMLAHPNRPNPTVTLSETSGFPRLVQLTATLTVAGTFTPNGTVTYTAVITNNGPQTQPDSGGPEFSVFVPSSLTVQTINADRGTVGTFFSRRSWDGSLAVGESATITITATINNDVTPGTIIRVQGQAAADTNLNGTNETIVFTDDPTVAGTANPTDFRVQ